MSDRAPSSRAAVVLFTKPPRAGKVKTRLIGELTAEQAAELHGAFLRDIYDGLSRGDFDLHVAWALDGEAAAALPDGELPAPPEHSFRQQGADLGTRLFHGLELTAARHDRVAAVGSDSPELTAEIVERAFSLLDGETDVVLGPTRDGGYYLIALLTDSVRPELFEGVAWSTETVLADTLERCRELELDAVLLPEVEDIDLPEDLELLARRLSASRTEPAGAFPVRTTALLTAWGRMNSEVTA